jgi:hypothetical protein
MALLLHLVSSRQNSHFSVSGSNSILSSDWLKKKVKCYKTINRFCGED